MSPDISVVFTSYNHKEYLDQVIEGFINQTYTNFELVIVDDCSTDGSQDILKKYVDDERVKLHLLDFFHVAMLMLVIMVLRMHVLNMLFNDTYVLRIFIIIE